MGGSGMDKTTKDLKEAKEAKTPTSQEQASSTSAGVVNPDWSGFQAYSPMPPHGFLASSPQAHPYMWGVQRIEMSDFSDVVLDDMAHFRKSVDTKVHASLDSQLKSGCRQDSLEAEASQNGNAAHGSQNGGPSTPQSMMNQAVGIMPMPAAGTPAGVPGPTTNLNIGMDYWGAATSSSIPAMHGKVPSAPVAGGLVTAGSRDSAQSQLWIQDERELKRQRRKQSNRESARRSRLRKQAECDELAKGAEVLKEENATLRAEVARIKSEYEQLLAQNASLKERLGEVPGQEDPRPGRNDQNMGTRAESLQSGQ
ncbi:unnamed protein product [Ilex paraguariensis]|uniref:BZIP domain-containing protein n=1 Tax=Ilex paraguariensis TaxID=185542 RepID=A0ABC8S8G0_9AQUA